MIDMIWALSLFETIYLVSMRVLIASLSLLFFSSSHAQRLQDGYGAKDTVNFEVVRQVVKFLKSRPLPEQITKNDPSFPTSWVIYDSLIDGHYDVKFRQDLGEGYDSSFSQLGFQKLLLYNADVVLDVVPADSVVIKREPEEFPIPTGSSVSPLTLYTVCFQVGDRLYSILTLVFTPKNKLFMIGPYIDFEELNKGVDVEGFYRRHGVDKVRHMLYEFKGT